MAAYVIASITVTDPAGFEEYRRGVPATIQQYGGRYLARGGAVEALEGAWQPKRLVVLEFPDAGRAKQWYDSPEYRDLKALRMRTSTGDVVIVAGT